MFIAMGLNGRLLDFVPAIIAAGFGTLRSFVFFWIFAKKTKRRMVTGRLFLLCFLVVALIAGVIAILNSSPEVRTFQWIVMVAALLFVLGQYLPNKHFVRLTAVIYALAFSLASTPLYILDGDFRWNPIGLMIEASKILSVVLFYILLLKKKDPNQKTKIITDTKNS